MFYHLPQGPIVQQNGSAAAAAGSKAALTASIEALLKSAPILLFMKVRMRQLVCAPSVFVQHTAAAASSIVADAMCPVGRILHALQRCMYSALRIRLRTRLRRDNPRPAAKAGNGI